MINEQIIRDNLKNILERREFKHVPDKNPLADAINRLFQTIWEWVKQLFQRYRPKNGSEIEPDFFNNELINVLKFILITVGVVFLFFIIRILVIRVYMPAKMKKGKYPNANANDYLDKPEEILKKIQILMGQKEYTEALCFIFVAVLLEFHKKRIIRIEKWKTNKVYIREIRQNAGEFLSPMREYAVAFNKCCYGGRKADETAVDALFEFFLKLREILI